MKITKKQLKRIIREEKARLLREDAGNMDAYFESPLPGTEPANKWGPRPATREEKFEDYVKQIEEIVEFHGQEFTDEGVKAAVKEALRRIGIN